MKNIKFNKRFFKTLLFEKISLIAELLGHKNHIAIRYFLKFGKRINWKHPEDLNQLICREMVFGHHPEWSLYADKIQVHDYIKSIGLSQILRPILAIYNTAQDINFAQLPDKCVIKTSNGYFDKIFYDRSKNPDEEAIRRHFAKLEKKKFGKRSGELHYLDIPFKIFAEPLIDNDNQDIKTTSAIDYKIWYIDGICKGIHMVYDREPENVKHQWRTPEWRLCNEYLIESPNYIISDLDIPKPLAFDQLIEFGGIISRNQKVLRVDFYVIGNRPYFGEITCTSYAGMIDQYSNQALKELISDNHN